MRSILGKVLPEVTKSSMRSSKFFVGGWWVFLATFYPNSLMRSSISGGGVFFEFFTKNTLNSEFCTHFLSHWAKLCITVSLSHTTCMETNERIGIYLDNRVFRGQEFLAELTNESENSSTREIKA